MLEWHKSSDLKPIVAKLVLVLKDENDPDPVIARRFPVSLCKPTGEYHWAIVCCADIEYKPFNYYKLWAEINLPGDFKILNEMPKGLTSRSQAHWMRKLREKK